MNQILSDFIKDLYTGFSREIEVMAIIGYSYVEETNTGRVEMVEYITSNQRDTVQGSIKNVVRLMSEYNIARKGKARVILVHNHPSGTMTPSQADIEVSRKMEVATKLMGIKYLGSYIYTSENNELTIVERSERLSQSDDIREIFSNNLLEDGQLRVALYNSHGNIREQWIEELNELLVYTLNLKGRSIQEEGILEDLDDYVEVNEFEPYLLIELDDQNTIRGIYELNKLQPDSEVSPYGGGIYFGMSTVFKRGKPRLAIYDKRENIERDEVGVASDMRAFSKAMNVLGHPINFYIQDE